MDNWLVVFRPTPLKFMMDFVSGVDDIPNIATDIYLEHQVCFQNIGTCT
jgi:hypothetical protein